MSYSGHLKHGLFYISVKFMEEAIAALPVEESLQYESVKAAILRSYELVLEAYRQKSLRKTVYQNKLLCI